MKTLKESILSRSSLNSETTKKKILIEEWLEKYNIKNYTINDNFEIDVDGYVNLYRRNITKFPEYIQFGVVRGYFSCEDCGLTSLRGCPRKVEGDFNCADNNLTSLKGCPVEIRGEFDCRFNNLTSLDGAPEKVEGEFIWDYNLK